MHTLQKYKQTHSIAYKTLPKIGYIALLNKQPIAAGFLRRVEGGYAQIDTLVTNPLFGSLIRDEGINKIVDALIQDAKDLKLTGVIAMTEHDQVIQRAIERGFSVIPQTIVGRLF